MGVIKSVQQVAVTIAAGATTGTATITSVVTANSFVNPGGYTCQVASAVPGNARAGIALTNATTVTATRNTSDVSNSMTVYGSVVEFASGVLKTNQSGTITMTAASSNTATITSVTTGNSAVVYQGDTSTSASNAFSNNTLCAAVLTNATTVTANRSGSLNNSTVYYTVLEFNSGILQSSTQAVSISLSTVQLTNTATITSVTTGNSMLVFGGTTNNNAANWSQFAADYPWITLTNGTTLTATRTAENSTVATINATVIEFPVNTLKSVNRGSIIIGSGSTSNTATISSVTTTRTSVAYMGGTAAGGAGNVWNVQESAAQLTNATTVTALTNSQDATNTRTVGYEAIEFNPTSTNGMFLAL